MKYSKRTIFNDKCCVSVLALGLLAFLFWMACAPAGPQAVALAADAPPFVIAVPPRGTMKVAVNGHCLDYGLPFPGSTLKPVGLAEEKVRALIRRSLAEGYYAPAALYQTQWAIWHFTDNVDISGEKNKQASDLVAYAQGGAKPGDLDAGSASLVDAVSAGAVSVALSDFKNISNPAYFGKGTLVITNLSEKTQVLHLPYGMIFEDTRLGTAVQQMAVFPAEIPQKGGDSLAMKAGVCNQLSVKLPANASTKILIHGYCLNYGLPFPGKVIRSASLAPDVIRNSICYNLAKGYVESDLWQAQLSIWRQTDKLDKGSGFPLVNEIAGYAESGVKPGDISQPCTLLSDAIDKGLVSADIDDFTNTSDPEYFGKGTMALKNLSAQAQTICIPFGTVYTDETQDGVQDMGVFPDMNPDPKDVEAQTEPDAKQERVLMPASGGLYPKTVFGVVGIGLLGAVMLVAGCVLRRKAHAG